jgi:hypothetical protein
VADEIANLVQTGEWCWHPAEGLPSDPELTHVKDLGIDGVVWKLFGDRRCGNIFILINCACGDDWEGKFDDIKLDVLREQWFRPLSKPTPTKAFAVPRHIPNSRHFEDVNLSAGITLDRARLALLAESASKTTILGQYRQRDLEALIKFTIPDFLAA